MEGVVLASDYLSRIPSPYLIHLWSSKNKLKPTGVHCRYDLKLQEYKLFTSYSHSVKDCEKRQFPRYFFNTFLLILFVQFRENMPSHFKVKEYCPLVFRNLRERFGVDDVDYRESLTRSQPVQIDSSGKSGAQFYRSYDKYFIMKTLTSEEIERMHAFLKHYHPVSTLNLL